MIFAVNRTVADTLRWKQEVSGRLRALGRHYFDIELAKNSNEQRDGRTRIL